MSWNLDSNRPIYPQIMERITMDIISGTYPPGSKLPSVRELAQEAGVNPTQCRNLCPNWNEQDFSTASGPADALSRRI